MSSCSHYDLKLSIWNFPADLSASSILSFAIFFNRLFSQLDTYASRYSRQAGEDVGTRPRPILVQFANRHIKNLIMESLYKIKSLAMKFKNIVVAHDLTKKQKLECKELVAQAKLRSENESGDFLTESGVHREI